MTRTTTDADAPLTDRQREVIALIAAGCSNDEVGRSSGSPPAPRRHTATRSA
ncbi:MAG: hypothetical protein M5U27_12485 [Gaiella sp.]|nr:hypothetical protein [Gaiella sp.]